MTSFKFIKKNPKITIRKRFSHYQSHRTKIAFLYLTQNLAKIIGKKRGTRLSRVYTDPSLSKKVRPAVNQKKTCISRISADLASLFHGFCRKSIKKY